MSQKRSIETQVASAKRDDKRARKAMLTTDSFQNFLAKSGLGTDNLQSASTYGINPITRQRTLLEWIHRGSWLGGVAVDLVADDMTRAGVEFLGKMKPEDSEELDTTATQFNVWGAINYGIKMSRLYGGAIVVPLLADQDYSKPWRVSTTGKDQFKGLAVFDRWMVQPSLNDVVTELGPDLGEPKYYEVIRGMAPALPGERIHYSRCLRLVGIELPWWQRITENMWGISVLERLYDRMVAFDSATQGASQLVYKSYLRTYKIEKLRELIASGGKQMQALLQFVDMMRRTQNNEGVTLIDAKDDLSSATYTGFGGLADALMQFGQQLAGALQIPLVRLFGQSPAGLNSTGESDLRTYYDGINQQQVKCLLVAVTRIYRAMALSQGITLPDNFGIRFRPLWQLTDKEKADIASSVTSTVLQAYETGAIPVRTALEELRQSSRTTGVFTNILDEDIEAAEEAEQAPQPDEMGALGAEEGGVGGEEAAVSAAAAGAPSAPSPGGKAKTITSSAQGSSEFGRLLASNAFGRGRNFGGVETRDANWKEDQHPRGRGEKGGQFISKGESPGTSKTEPTKSIKRNPKQPAAQPSKRQLAGGLVEYAGVHEHDWMDWAVDPEPYQAVLQGDEENLMHNGTKLTPAQVEKTKQVAQAIKKAAETHAVSNVYLYRGETYPNKEAVLKQFKTGKWITTGSLMSTATEQDAAEQYANTEHTGGVPVVLRIGNPNGHRGVQTAPMGVPSNEVILPPDERYRVTRLIPYRDGFIVDLYSAAKLEKDLIKVDASNPGDVPQEEPPAETGHPDHEAKKVVNPSTKLKYRVDEGKDGSITEYTLWADDAENDIDAGSLVLRTGYGDALQVDDAFMRKEYRGKGLGKEMYLRGLQVAKEKGFKYLRSSRGISPDAERVWKSLGAEHRDDERWYLPTDKKTTKDDGASMKTVALLQGWHNLHFVCENPKGSVRSGKGWSMVMPYHYGYLLTGPDVNIGADDDAIDACVGPNPESPAVFIVDQRDLATGAFDEHKVMLGYATGTQAMDAYIAGYDSRGRDRIGAFTELDMNQFRVWLQYGDHTQPYSKEFAAL